LLSIPPVSIGNCQKKISLNEGEASMRKYMSAILLSSCLILTSCAEVNTLEKMGLITTVGYDMKDDGKILTTMVMLQIDPDIANTIGVVSSSSYTSKGARLDANRKTAKKLQSGQLRVALYSEEIAENGFYQLADTFARDSSISDLVYLGVVEGEVKELLEHKTEQISDISQNIYKKLDQNIKGEQIPSSTLQETLHDYYSVGIEPILPILKLQKDLIEISGLAIFRDDKMVGKLDHKQGFYLKLINDRYKAGGFELVFKPEGVPKNKLSDNIALVLDTIQSKSDIKLIDKNNLKYKIKIKLNARLLEVNSKIHLMTPKEVREVEKLIEKKMKSEIEELINYCKSKNSDVIGFGEVYRSSVKDSKLTKKKWHKMYKDINVNVDVDFSLIRTGTME
jgi:spore germination protein